MISTFSSLIGLSWIQEQQYYFNLFLIESFAKESRRISYLNKFLIEKKRDEGVDDCHAKHKKGNPNFFCTQTIVRKRIKSMVKNLVALTNCLQIDDILV